MPHTVVGVFRDSGDADIAAAELRDSYTLAANEVELLVPAGYDMLERPGVPDDEAVLTPSLTGVGLSGGYGGEMIALGKRWGDKVADGQTLVIGRANDPTVADEMAETMRQLGAYRVDKLPH